ncbi:MAG: ABC transporter ATP-binding protein [Pirellulales bacterium]|nr:ABC transporter ATP-binding protein [Pirellulales bacterium]
MHSLPAQPVVQLRHVSKEYYRDKLRIPVLADTSLDIPAGEFVAVMGPSGSGKSTLLNLCAGLDRPTTGTIVVAGQDLGELSESQLTRWRSEHLGFIFQLYNLMPVLTAFENVELPLLLTNLSRRERARHVETALRIVGLEDRMHHYPRQLSGGQEQRVAIARAIVTDPVLLLADEPTGNLDAVAAVEVLDLLAQLNAEFGKTIVMVTHDPRAARRAHRILHLEKGRFEEADIEAIERGRSSGGDGERRRSPRAPSAEIAG